VKLFAIFSLKMSKSTKDTKVDTKKRKDPPKDDDSQNRSSEKKQKTKKKKCEHKFKVDVDGGSDGITVYVCTKCEVHKNGVFNNDLANNHGHLFDELELKQDDGIPTWICEICGCLDDTNDDGECKRHEWSVHCDDCDNNLDNCYARRKETIASYIAFLENELESTKILAGIYADMCECKSRSMTFARGPPHSDTRCGTCLKEVQQSQFLSSGIRVTQINAGTGGTAVAVGGSSVVRLSR
jgi:hypothetical protein